MNLVIALLQAAVLWSLQQSLTSGIWPATSAGLSTALYLVVLGVPPALLILWSHHEKPALWKSVTGLATFLGVAGYLAFRDFPAPFKPWDLDDVEAMGFIAPLLLGWLLFLSLLRARLESGRWRSPYPTLFRSASGSLLTLAEAAIFTGLFWILLFLWAALFEILGNSFFKDVFGDPRFAYPATTVAFALAVQVIGASDRWIAGVLEQILGLLKWLLPLAGLIVVAFTLALIPKLPALLGSGQKVLDSGILLALIVVTMLLINAAFRDGETEPDYGAWLRQALRIVPVLLTVVAVTALYSLLLRTIDLGLTPSRYWGLVTATFAFLLTAGYAYAAVRRGPWLSAIRKINFSMAVVLLVALAIGLTPVGDPLRWSVTDQLQRALTAQTEESRDGALNFLRFDAGMQGKRALQALAKSESALGREAARLLAASSRPKTELVDPSATPERLRRWRASIRTYPEGSSITIGLDAALRDEFLRSASTLDPGGNAPQPIVVFADLNADGANEAMLIAGTRRGDPQIVRDYRIFVGDGVDQWRRASRGEFK